MSSARLTFLALSPVLVPFLLAQPPQETQFASPSIVTLYARDDLQSSFDFRGGSAGGRVVRGEVRLDAAQIIYDVLEPGRISYGFTRDERVEILDLGDVSVPPEPRARDRAVEIPLSVVHTVCLTDSGFSIVSPGNDLDPFQSADRILGPPPPVGVRHIDPLLGHTYLVRVRRNRSSDDEFFKFRVIDLVPEHSLTIRWATVPRCN
jgi:hypothetical protein